MKLARSILIHPTNYDVRVEHLSIWRNAKSNPTICADIYSKVNRLFFEIKVPMNFVAVLDVSGIGILILESLDT